MQPAAESVGDARLGDLRELISRMRQGDRDAAAVFVDEYGDYIRRRVRGKLGTSVRRLFDSQDILSTVSRRLDRYVRHGRVQAESVAQLWALIHKIAETAVIDRVRATRRLKASEGEDGPIARALLARMEEEERTDANGSELVLEKVYHSLATEKDREVLTMWLSDMPLFRIAEAMGSTPAAVRMRWKSIRDQLRERLEAGAL